MAASCDGRCRGKALLSMWSLWVDAKSGNLWYELLRAPLGDVLAAAEEKEGSALAFSPIDGDGRAMRAEGAFNIYFAHALTEESPPPCRRIRSPYVG